MAKLPAQYEGIKKRFKGYFDAVNNLGKAARKAGPISAKNGHLIQLAAAAANRSEGSVHSHVRRAMQAGAKPAEIYHTLLLLTSTIGFPAVSSALSWADDVMLGEKGKKKK